ncbi:vWA domain-containing protein [Pseudodesulfovibrio sediminis]|nr:VWA-like domain-containing protein [Pseudodesulfovibrio sediminis]
MDAAKQKIIKARTSLLLEHPFFGSLCLRMEPTEDTCCATAWTDGRRLAYNPGYVNGLTDVQVRGLMAHTVMHPACQHHTRRKGRDPQLWNVACDHAINWILLKAGIELPPKYFDNPKYHALTADEIYFRIKEEHDDEDRPSFSDEQGESDGDTEWDGLPGEARDGEDSCDGEQSAGGESGGDGEINDTHTGEQEGQEGSEQFGDPGGSGEVRDSGQSEQGAGAEESGNDEEWALALAQAAQQARDMGDLPGGLERLIGEVLYPKIDWQEYLARFICDRARDDYSWTPPNKRFLHMDVVLPSLSHQKLPEVVIALDTSGSISEAEMNQFGAELSGILESFDTTIHVVYCDSQVSGFDSFDRNDLPLEIRPEGGGGTDYRPVFSWVERENITPVCLVYLTDMECIHYPEKEPEYPVLWAQIGGGRKVPPFGDVLEVQ